MNKLLILLPLVLICIDIGGYFGAKKLASLASSPLLSGILGKCSMAPRKRPISCYERFCIRRRYG